MEAGFEEREWALLTTVGRPIRKRLGATKIVSLHLRYSNLGTFHEKELYDSVVIQFLWH